jgi:hypothetical protein
MSDMVDEEDEAYAVGSGLLTSCYMGLTRRLRVRV